MLTDKTSENVNDVHISANDLGRMQRGRFDVAPLGRTTDRCEEFPKALIERRPWYQRLQTNQAMAHVDDGTETLAKQIGIGAVEL